MKKFKLFQEELVETEGEYIEKEKEESKEGKTPLLDSIGIDMTQMAKDGKLDPIFGREKEIFQILLILCRKKKNNPVIIGEPGVGKTALVEGMAQMIVEERCPSSLQGKRIVYVDMGSMIAGASKQGDYEKRIKTIMNELRDNPDVILFIDEVHMMVNKSASIDAANMFKPALARGEMRLIGATTLKEYKESIEKDGALERRFQKVTVDPPSKEETLEILKQIKSKYEDYHMVTYEDDALTSCVRLADRYLTDRFFPDKAIDLMDEVGSMVRLSQSSDPVEVKDLMRELLEVKKRKNQLLKDQKFEEGADARSKEKEISDKISNLRKDLKASVKKIVVTDANVAKIISMKIGVPVDELTGDEGSKLLDMEKNLNLQIIGQGDAVKRISKCIKRNRVGIRNQKKPSGVFLFLGSTGVGKTHTVKQLAKFLFNSEDAMIRFDMSEYMEKHSVSRFIGAPPGYVGYAEGGQLTERVRRKPYSILLLDEIEKAHPDVLNSLLQVFDDGQLTDGHGVKVNFKNTIIIMTSNIGSAEIKNTPNGIGFAAITDRSNPEEQSKKLKATILKALHAKMAPEFINRIDDIIIFSKLGKGEIHRIIDLEVADLSKRLKEAGGYTLNITDNVKNLLMEVGWDEEMGARPMKRAIQSQLEDPISDEILRKKIKDVINIDYDTSKKELIINGEIFKESFKNKFINRLSLIVETKFSSFRK